MAFQANNYIRGDQPERYQQDPYYDEMAETMHYHN